MKNILYDTSEKSKRIQGNEVEYIKYVIEMAKSSQKFGNEEEHESSSERRVTSSKKKR